MTINKLMSSKVGYSGYQSTHRFGVKPCGMIANFESSQVDFGLGVMFG